MIGHHSHAAASPDAHTRGHLIHWARFYDACVFLCTLGRAGAMREEAADLAAIQPGESVLEVGCGTGELTRRARARAGSSAVVCGIDRTAGEQFIETDFENLRKQHGRLGLGHHGTALVARDPRRRCARSR